MKRTIFLYGIYLILIAGLESCRKEHYLITVIDFSGATITERGEELQWNNFTATDTFINDIVFIVSYHTQYLYSMHINFTDKCYAQFDPGTENDNYLINTSYSIKLNRPFTYRELLIEPGTNILSIPQIQSQVLVYDSAQGFNLKGADKVFEFSPDFVSNTIFEDKIYTVTFSCMTSDFKQFEKTIDVRFRN